MKLANKKILLTNILNKIGVKKNCFKAFTKIIC